MTGAGRLGDRALVRLLRDEPLEELDELRLALAAERRRRREAERDALELRAALAGRAGSDVRTDALDVLWRATLAALVRDADPAAVARLRGGAVWRGPHARRDGIEVAA